MRCVQVRHPTNRDFFRERHADKRLTVFMRPSVRVLVLPQVHQNQQSSFQYATIGCHIERSFLPSMSNPILNIMLSLRTRSTQSRSLNTAQFYRAHLDTVLAWCPAFKGGAVFRVDAGHQTSAGAMMSTHSVGAHLSFWVGGAVGSEG